MTFSFAAVRQWQPSRGLLVGLALILQTALILRAFGALFTEPGRFLLVDTFDGSKNYYTFLAYVQQPWANGLRWFGMMNYPFGDYLYYTDNTPPLAWTVRVWSHYISDLTPYSLELYHGLLLLGLLLSTGLLVLLLHRLLRHWGLVLLFALMLPWLNPQTERLLLGHFSLSYSWVVLLAIWGVMRLYRRVQDGQPVRGLVAGLVAGFILAGLVHLYYLMLLALLTAGFFAWWLLPRRRWLRYPRLTGVGALLTVGPVAACFLLIRLTDAYYSLRRAKATGFDYPVWKLQLSALTQSYSYESIRFVLEARPRVSYESGAYLGAFALFSLLLLGLVWLLRRGALRAYAPAWRRLPARRPLLLLLGAALIGLLASIGTEYTVADDQYVFQNYLSVFYYLQKITAAASHFRAVARFSWPFFWAVNLLVLVGLDFWLSQSRWRGRWVLAAGLVVLALVDTRDTIKHYRKSLLPNVLTDIEQQPELNNLLYSVRPEQYQAILPVPFFHVGSEDLALTVDDENAHSLRCYQLALRTNLPLMASKMARTPPEHLRQLRTLFDPAGPAPELKARLQADGRPVLVLFDQRYYDGSNPFAASQANPQARQLIEAGAQLPARLPLTLLAEAGPLRLYSWAVR
ncbi:hypothetical protein [Hymenobacter sp. DG01]|uniref:hypothetical protein n=1 Tax=Hymenobacter sp. DG01 TaxID=2584940 RepID=UPI00112376C8|nr:hypothetical protein [Hymenobacter sp. DG01]